VTAGANPTSLQRGIMQAFEAIVEELKKISAYHLQERVESRNKAAASNLTISRPVLEGPILSAFNEARISGLEAAVENLLPWA
jgi:chaperonin GroEL (HSP60 family)